jgi:signal transduction histidine kinase
VVIGYATLLADEAKDVAARNPEMGAKLIEYSQVISSAAEYCHHLSENWRHSSKKLAQMTRVDLVQVAREVQQVIFFGNNAIEILGEDQAEILGSKFELMRIFQNILKNSIEAGAKNVKVTFAATDNGVTLEFYDNGAGMDAESVRRALQGGFTNKATGTGLGLGICRHLVSAHGGTFHLESKKDEGTTIRLTFPAARQT